MYSSFSQYPSSFVHLHLRLHSEMDRDWIHLCFRLFVKRMLTYEGMVLVAGMRSEWMCWLGQLSDCFNGIRWEFEFEW